MQFYEPNQVPFSGGLRCRASRLKTTLGGLLMIGILIGAPVLWWYLNAPAFMWIGCAVAALLVVPPILGMVLATYRPSNWLMLVRPDGLWINLRSYANDPTKGVKTVLHLPYEKIASAAEHRESYTLPTSAHRSTSVQHRRQSLELRLKNVDNEAIREALAAERNMTGCGRTYFGVITVYSKVKHHPVTMVEEGMLRLAWRGPGDAIAPDLKTALQEIAYRVSVDQPTKRELPDWDKMNDDEIDRLVERLAASGRTMDASKLLVRRRGLSTTEAKQYVERLT
jgi:hypothetical protein